MNNHELYAQFKRALEKQYLPYKHDSQFGISFPVFDENDLLVATVTEPDVFQNEPPRLFLAYTPGGDMTRLQQVELDKTTAGYGFAVALIAARLSDPNEPRAPVVRDAGEREIFVYNDDTQERSYHVLAPPLPQKGVYVYARAKRDRGIGQCTLSIRTGNGTLQAHNLHSSSLYYLSRFLETYVDVVILERYDEIYGVDK